MWGNRPVPASRWIGNLMTHPSGYTARTRQNGALFRPRSTRRCHPHEFEASISHAHFEHYKESQVALNLRRPAIMLG